MKILFIGDIVGEPGRKAVQTILPRLRDEHALDFVIANGENSAGGNGITPQIAGELFSAGVDAITSGDHLWDQKTVQDLLYSEPRFLRPLNYPASVPGRGAHVFQVRNLPPVGVMNVQGRVFMQPMDNPFTTAGSIVIQGTAFNIFGGGVQQQGAAGSFGNVWGAGDVEFALDLYRISATESIPGQVPGVLRKGSYEGTMTVNSGGNVSFIAVPEPSALALTGLAACTLLRRRRRSA